VTGSGVGCLLGEATMFKVRRSDVVGGGGQRRSALVDVRVVG
jgi:hypothetical protein